jgi:hypothetical protein
MYFPDDIWNIIKSFYIENIFKKIYKKFVKIFNNNIYFSSITNKPCIFQINYNNKKYSIFGLSYFMYESWPITNQIKFLKYCSKNEIDELLYIIK